MTETPSTMLELGTRLPEFTLSDPGSGSAVSTRDIKGSRATLVMFICNHCPFVIHVRGEFSKLAADYMPKGVGMVAINSNDVDAYPQDGPEQMRELVVEQGWPFPFLLDETQETAKAFRAACTPDFFLFDADGRLVYRGQLDGSRPSNDVPVTGRDLRTALDAVLSGRPVSQDQRPSVGCNVKWRPGNEPPYS